MNDRVVTYKVSYSNSNESNDFSLTWIAPYSVDKIFPLYLKRLFHLKNRQVFLTHPVCLTCNGRHVVKSCDTKALDFLKPELT